MPNLLTDSDVSAMCEALSDGTTITIRRAAGGFVTVPAIREESDSEAQFGEHSLLSHELGFTVPFAPCHNIAANDTVHGLFFTEILDDFLDGLVSIVIYS